jgi:hypothetical protein
MMYNLKSYRQGVPPGVLQRRTRLRLRCRNVLEKLARWATAAPICNRGAENATQD